MANGRQVEGGFTYVIMLAALAITGLGLAAVGESWSAAARREREEQLLRVGAAYARAIEAYYQRSPGAEKRYPPTLDALVQDRRQVGTVRYLRRVYADPLLPSRPWGLVLAPDGGIMGVYSQSEQAPLRRRAVPGLQYAVVPALRYRDWRFIYFPAGSN
jgi:type II secretory pathway pseudopilin PulG